MSQLPIVIIGAGPVGLAAAARLLQEELPYLVLEAGDEVGASIAKWSHVRLFTPWRYLVDEAARQLLEQTGWSMPEETGVPTGGELLEGYLRPLAKHPALAPYIRTDSSVTAVTREGADKLSSTARSERPFEIFVRNAAGEVETVRARAVIDASGTYESPNPLGASGVPAIGERDAAAHLYYGIPDVLGRDRERFAGARVGVVGSGHSAFNALLDLEAMEEAEAPDVTWFIRSPSLDRIFGGEDADALSERGALGRRMRRLAESDRLRLETGFRTRSVHSTDDGVVLESEAGVRSAHLDIVVVVAGFRPDLDMLREVRLGMDPAVEAPTILAPLIDPNLHSCGTVPPHGFAELSHPEQDFYVVGMKSYGRAPTFLLLTGYEQTRSVVKALAGDLEAAADVQLVLPETRVCSTDLAGVTEAASCCGPTPEVPTTDTGGCCAPSAPVSIGIGARRKTTSGASYPSEG